MLPGMIPGPGLAAGTAGGQSKINTVAQAVAYIGNATGNETSVDDGDTNQSHTTGVTFGNNVAAWIGWDFGAGNEKIITGMEFWGTNNRGINENNAGNQTCVLRGNNSAPASRTDGTAIVSILVSVANATNIDVIDLTGTNTTAYRYAFWDSGATSSGSAQLAECEIYETL